MKSVVFMDHWGTIALADKHGREHKKEDLPNISEMHTHGKLIDFDKEAVKVLNEIIQQTDCEIVVSSDWKKWCPLDKMKEFYLSQGIIKAPIEYTPNLKGKNIFETRAFEIKDWLNTHKVDNWAAVDDLYLGDYLTNFVWISRTDEGITQNKFKDIISSFLI